MPEASDCQEHSDGGAQSKEHVGVEGELRIPDGHLTNKNTDISDTHTEKERERERERERYHYENVCSFQSNTCLNLTACICVYECVAYCIMFA